MTNNFDLFTEPEIITVGGFPLPKFGSLPEDEKDAFRQQELDASDETTKLVTLVKKIAAEQGISQTEAVEIIKTAETSNDNLGILVNYLSDLRSLRNPELARMRQKRDIAALVLRSRLDPEWIFENIDRFKRVRKINLELESVLIIRSLPEEKWLKDATRKAIIDQIVDRLPEHLVNEIAGFFFNEDRQWVEYAAEPVVVEGDADFVEKSSGSTRKDGTKSRKNEPSPKEPTTLSKTPA